MFCPQLAPENPAYLRTAFFFFPFFVPSSASSRSRLLGSHSSNTRVGKSFGCVATRYPSTRRARQFPVPPQRLRLVLAQADVPERLERGRSLAEPTDVVFLLSSARGLRGLGARGLGVAALRDERLGGPVVVALIGDDVKGERLFSGGSGAGGGGPRDAATGRGRPGPNLHRGFRIRVRVQGGGGGGFFSSSRARERARRIPTRRILPPPPPFPPPRSRGPHPPSHPPRHPVRSPPARRPPRASPCRSPLRSGAPGRSTVCARRSSGAAESHGRPRRSRFSAANVRHRSTWSAEYGGFVTRTSCAGTLPSRATA